MQTILYKEGKISYAEMMMKVQDAEGMIQKLEMEAAEEGKK